MNRFWNVVEDILMFLFILILMPFALAGIVLYLAFVILALIITAPIEIFSRKGKT